MVLVTMEIPQLRLDTVVDGPFLQVVQFPVVTPRLIPMVQTVCRTTEILQLLQTMFNALVVQGVLVVDIPVVVQRPIIMVLPVWMTIETPLCSTFPGGRCPCCAGRASPVLL